MTARTINLTQVYATQVVFGNGWREDKDVEGGNEMKNCVAEDSIKRVDCD